MRQNGIYFNEESEVFGLYWNGEFIMISVLKDDCEVELARLENLVK